MIDKNKFARVFGQVAAVVSLLSLHTGTARAGLLLDWRVSVCVTLCTNDQSSSTDPPFTQHNAIASNSVGSSVSSAFQSPGGWDLAGVRVAKDLPDDSDLAATAKFEFRVHNNGPDPIPLKFQFLILNGRLEIGMVNFQSAGDFPESHVRATFAEVVGLNQWNPIYWDFQGEVAGANSSSFPSYKSVVVDPQHIGFPAATENRALGTESVALAAFGGTLNLGNIAPGFTREFIYQLFAEVENGTYFDNTGGAGTLPPFEVTGLAELADPFGLGSSFLLNDIPFSEWTGFGDEEEPPVDSVPEPPAWLLLASGLAAFAWLTRRAPNPVSAGKD